MEELRQLHNRKKRELILGVVRPGNYVLDCGCGRGGDLQKWRMSGASRIVGVDPDPESLREAQGRADTMGMKSSVIFLEGDIRSVHINNFDVVCYNFSIHYIRESLGESARAIARCVKPGGYLIGITPDRDRINAFVSPDSLGNRVDPVDSSHVSVWLADGPFYADGPKVEPTVSKGLLEQALKPWFTLEKWDPMLHTSTGLISDIYSTFIFRRKQ